MAKGRAGFSLEAVTFDVTHTLLECPALGEQYAAVLARHGLEVDARDIETAIPLVWQELACSAEPSRDRFASHPRGARGFWQRFVERTCALLGTERPSPFAAAELFDRFARAEAWRIADGAPELLAELKRRGLKLAVISNWDERLPTLLERLDLGRFFDATIVSSLVGVEKPHPRIFETALTALDVEAARALHVGDSRLDDLEGALAAGMHALLLSRKGEGDLTDLRELPALLDDLNDGRVAAG
jgi:putative hydrolase of the HAD superfamily